MPHPYPRFCQRRITTAMKDTPVVLLNGPRQSGKTTLAQQLANPNLPYFTLDDATTLAAARGDAQQFLAGLEGAVIDEVQRAPELLLALKLSVDRDRRPGRFVLTGSADILTLPRIADSLAGRMEVITLLPLSQAEVLAREPDFLAQAFAGRLSQPREWFSGADLVDAVLTGGFPEMLQRESPERRRAWARDYIGATLLRDVRDIAEATRLDALPRLLRLLAGHAAQLVNFSQLGAGIGLDDKTVRRYVGLLEQLFIVRRIEPWFANENKRLVKTPKLHFIDSGLLSSLQGLSAEKLKQERRRFGPLLENFVLTEVLRHIGWQDDSIRVSHLRTRDGDEVDIVLEHADGSVVGIEVKAASSVGSADFKGLRQLAAACGEAFRLGVVMYDGAQAVPFGDRLWAAPLSCLFASATPPVQSRAEAVKPTPGNPRTRPISRPATQRKSTP